MLASSGGGRGDLTLTVVADYLVPVERLWDAYADPRQLKRVSSVTTFPTIEAMEQLVQMGMIEGMRSAMGQIDAVLVDLASFAARAVRQWRRSGASRSHSYCQYRAFEKFQLRCDATPFGVRNECSTDVSRMRTRPRLCSSR